uniref:Focadhesin n=1 Tax=Astyanax mexicanus TaxID=7994 RepID=A0A8B9KE04_ASTMX
MNETLKKRLEFPSSLIQAQAVRSLVTAVLKEKGHNEKISESTTQGAALEALWEQCSSESGVVRSACCDALVLLVEQGHADLQYVLNSILNLLPSARSVQGLIKVVGRLLQIQASQRDKTTPFTCPYSIRSSPHPYITVLENRPDCWPALLQEIDDFIQLAADKDEPLHISMLAPFLRYLYCEPQRLAENALLRHSLLRVLLQPREGQDSSCTRVTNEILRCLVQLFPHVLVRTGREHSLAESLITALLGEPECWRAELAQLALQLVCACQLSLQLGGELRSLLHTLHQILPVCREVSSDRHSSSTQLTLPLSTWYSELRVATSVLNQISEEPIASVEWLYSVQSTLPLCDNVPDALPLLITHLIISSEGDLCRLALDTAAAIAEADPAQVPCLLPVVMLKLGQVSDPALSHALLSTLPKLGTHKFCIPQVLHVLQALASSPKLRAVALRLLTSLWQKQDRVYPDLQKLMAVLEKSSVVVGKEAQWEQILARAASVRDICRERPYQHGGDMLAAITDMLTQCSRKDHATPAALALQGLQELCRAEVVDIDSTWRALSPKLSCETRPLVLKATAELLSLVPSLHVKTEQYEVQYDLQLFFFSTSLCISSLPEMNQPEDEDDEEKENKKEEDLTVPGTSYIKLVALTPRPVSAALETFLTALVRQEMSQMPRGVYHSALRGANLRSDQGKTVAGIPAFMLKSYEKNKQPGLKPGLAAGLLLCYDLPVQTDRDGRLISRFMVSRGRSFQQTLTSLIHEVNIQPSEWHRSLLLPQAWRGFMSRTFHAVLQGRKAELEMLQKQGKESPEELQYKQHCAWLWVRDQLTDVVKSAAKDSPVVQGNCVLALSGLAVVLSRYESSLPAQSDGAVEVGPEILPTTHWLSMVIDTLLSIVSSSSRPKGQVFPWFVHRSYSGENTASGIARSCAALGLALLVPVLVTSHRDAVPTILSTLSSGLPGAPTADETQALQFHSGLALGMLLAWLNEERVSDIAGQSMWELLLNTLEPLEACCFNTQLEYKCVSNTSIAILSFAWKNMIISVVLNMQLYWKLCFTLTVMQVLAYSVACVGVSAFSSGVVDASKAEEVMNVLRSVTEESQQTPGFALALGLTVHGLSSCGHGKAEDIHPRLLAAWTKILLAEGCPTMQRLAALNGLIALVGSETGFLFMLTCMFLCFIIQFNMLYLLCFFTVAMQIISFSGAIGLQSNGACLVGHLHLAHMSSSHSRTAGETHFTLPSDLAHWPEFFPPDGIKVVLAPLATVGDNFQYPPVNWNAILSPMMRLNFGEEVQHHCLELAANQAQSSPSAALFLGVWLAPPLVHSLSLRTRALLYECLCSWMKHVAEDKLQVYVESLAVQQFNPDTRAQRHPLCLAILQGLAKAMSLPNPAQNCWSSLCTTTEKIYNLLPDHIQPSEVELYEGICSCLSEMSDTEIDRIVKVTEANVEKTTFILSYLSSKGRIPLLGLNDIISTVLQKGKTERISWLFLQCLYQSRLASSPNTGVSKRMEWLLELMGHIRKVTYGASVKCNSVREGTDFLLEVFAAAVVSWANHSTPVIVGVRAQWFPWRQFSAEYPDVPRGLYVNSVSTDESVKQCVLAVPYALKLLLDKEPWKSQSQKFIDWLFSITEAPEEALSPTAISTARAALLALKSNPEFKKKTVWTRAYGW